MDCLLDHKLYFPYVIGVSAKLPMAAELSVTSEGRNPGRYLCATAMTKRYVGIGNLMKTSKVCLAQILSMMKFPINCCLLHWQAFYDYPGQGWVGVTNADTGEAEYINCQLPDKQCTMLRATCCDSLSIPAIELNGKTVLWRWFGRSDPNPPKAIADGCDKHLIILTRCKGLCKGTQQARTLSRLRVWKEISKAGAAVGNKTSAYSKKPCSSVANWAWGQGADLTPWVADRSFEKDLNKLQAAYDMGYQMAEAHLDEIKAILKPSNKIKIPHPRWCGIYLLCDNNERDALIGEYVKI